jgi:hypothetical protein
MATEIAAKGDLIVGTGAATFDNLTVGANGTTLVADSSTATGLKWATPATAASGLTLVKRATFANVAGTTTTFDGVFTAAYTTYLINIDYVYTGTATNDVYFYFRYGTTTQGAYTGLMYGAGSGASALTFTSQSGAAQATIALESGVALTTATVAQIYVNNVGTGGSLLAHINGSSATQWNTQTSIFGVQADTARDYTGFQIASTSNITGGISVYGLANA